MGVRRPVLPSVRRRRRSHRRPVVPHARPSRRVSDQIGACMGIPGITAHRAVFTNGTINGAAVLLHGVLGGVGMLATPSWLAWLERPYIGTVRRSADLELVDDPWADRVASLDHADPGGCDLSACPRRHRPPDRGRLLRQRRPRRHGRQGRCHHHDVPRLRSPRPGLPHSAADAPRQRDDPPARKRRLPAGGQAAGSERPDGSEPSGRSGDPVAERGCRSEGRRTLTNVSTPVLAGGPSSAS